jgi:hypothetical protein
MYALATPKAPDGRSSNDTVVLGAIGIGATLTVAGLAMGSKFNTLTSALKSGGV